MKYSIVVPVYKVEKYLPKCIDSILEQTHKDIEIILVDDGSPDGSGKICDEYAKRDGRIKVIHKENGGPSDARNAGMMEVTGDYIVFVDSDDSLAENNAIQTIDENIKKEVDVVFTNNESKIQNGVSGKELLAALLNDMGSFGVAVWDKIYRADFIKSNKLFFEKGYVHEDNLWTVQVLFNAGTCQCIPCNFYDHIENNESIVREVSQKAYYRRSVSRLHIAKKGIDYFLQFRDEDITKGIIAWYMGLYLNGLLATNRVEDAELIKSINAKIEETKEVLGSGFLTANTKYRIITVIYRLFGYRAVKAFLKTKYK